MARGWIRDRVLDDGKTKRYDAAIWVKTTAGSWKRQWKTFGRKKEAEAFLDQRSQAHREGDYREPAKMRFREFAEEWLSKYPKLAEDGLKDSTFASYYSAVQRHLLPFFGERLLEEISPASISKDFLSELAGLALAKKTQRNILLLLRKMLESALAWGYLHSNPFARKHEVRLPRTKRS
jgi:Phage integrase, N-terminal SAM-like domain